MAEAGRSQAEVARELVKSGTIEGGSARDEGGEITPPSSSGAARSSGAAAAAADDTDTPSNVPAALVDSSGGKASRSSSVVATEEDVALTPEEVEEQNKAAIGLQAQLRGRAARKELKQQNKAATGLQAAERGRAARKSGAAKSDDLEKEAKRRASLTRAVDKNSPRTEAEGDGAKGAEEASVSPRTALTNAIIKDVELQQSKSQEALEGDEGAVLTTDDLEEQNKAAIGLQAQLRGRAARKELDEQKQAAVRLQSQVRGRNARKNALDSSSAAEQEQEQEQEQTSAEALPALDGIDENAVVKIQSRTRGLLGRQAAQRHADKKQEDTALQHSVVKIQSRTRGHLTRKSAVERDARHEREKHQRDANASLLEGMDENAVVKIQSRTRGLLTRKAETQRQERAELLEGIDEDSVTRIQSRTRGMLARKKKCAEACSSSGAEEDAKLMQEAEAQFGEGGVYGVVAGAGDMADMDPDEVFAAKDVMAKRKIKQEALARRRLKEEARVRRERMAEDLRSRREEDLNLFKGGPAQQDLPPLNPSAPSGKPSNRGNFKRPANLKKMNVSGIAGMDPEEERARLGLPPSPRAKPAPTRVSPLKNHSPGLRSRDEMDAAMDSGPHISPHKLHLPSLGDMGGMDDDPYASRSSAPRRKVKKPLYKRLEENYQKEAAEAERKKNLEYQKIKMKKQMNAPSREEIAEHRSRVDSLKRDREEQGRRRRNDRDYERDERRRYEPIVARVKQPTVRDQFLSNEDPYQSSPTKAAHKHASPTNTFHRQIKKEMEEKKSARQKELDKRREKVERAKSYGDKVRRAAPGTENERDDGGDMQNNVQSYASPSRRPMRRTGKDPYNDGGGDGGGGYGDENYPLGGGGSDGEKDYYEVLAEKEARAQRTRNFRGPIRGGGGGGSGGEGPARMAPRRLGAGRQPLEPLAGSNRGDMVDAAERRAVGGSVDMLEGGDYDDHYSSPGARSRMKQPHQQKALRGGESQLDARTAAVMPKVSKWVANLMDSDGNEESLAKIYETGFQMLMAEKGISF